MHLIRLHSYVQSLQYGAGTSHLRSAEGRPLFHLHTNDAVVYTFV